MKETTKKHIDQIISDFLTSNKKVLLVVLSVIIGIIIVIGVISTIEKNKMENMVNSTIKLENLFNEVQNSDIDDKVFIEYATNTIDLFKGTKAELISYSRLASYYFDEKDFLKALDYYTRAYTNFPEDLATSVYMFNAAMSQEELGNSVEAIAILNEIVAQFKSSDINVSDKSADIPEVLFNLGRLYEKTGDLNSAKEKYEILVGEYKSYNLANIAKSRLLAIK